MSKSRLEYLDATRGLAALFIIVGHLFVFGVKHVDGVSAFKILPVIQIPIFVFLSGFFTTKAPDLSWRGIYNYWQSKATRLLLPLLVAPFVFHLVQTGGNIGFPLGEILEEYWFTFSLFQLFVGFYVARVILLFALKACPEDKRAYAEMCLLFLSIFVVEYAIAYTSSPYYAINDQLGKVHWLYKYLVLGHLLGRSGKLQEIFFSPQAGAVALLTMGVALYPSLNQYNEISYTGGVISNNCLASVGAICFIISSLKHSYRDNKLSRALCYLGQNSLPIYLTHYLFIPSLTFVVPLLEVPTRYGLSWEFAIAAFGLLLVLPPTLLVIRLIQSNPYLNFFIYGEPLPKTKA